MKTFQLICGIMTMIVLGSFWLLIIVCALNRCRKCGKHHPGEDCE